MGDIGATGAGVAELGMAGLGGQHISELIVLGRALVGCSCAGGAEGATQGEARGGCEMFRCGVQMSVH